MKCNPKHLGHSFLIDGVELYNVLPSSMKELTVEQLRRILKCAMIEAAPYSLDECESALRALC